MSGLVFYEGLKNRIWYIPVYRKGFSGGIKFLIRDMEIARPK
jgi:hypothetical protein